MPPEGQATFLQHHFPDAPTQEHAARLGMWLFLATEVLLFTALFTGYALYRYLFSETFHAASKYIETSVGLTNTVVLITSSLTVALALHAARQGQGRRAAALLAATLAFGGVFMVLKGFEYHHHFVTGQLPGRFYAFAELAAPGAAMFFTIYFLMTGLHGLHVLIGMGVLGWLAGRAWRGDFSPAYHTPVELGGLYWHLVDLIWIFLFPLLYLI
ncbi:MAG TPA: cytochrome c oxidase subunit 3 family protein [Anaeromyxobacteraceae bacterium]|nr:cytochrome c oxidase subunit 3 family protein [Anaeromyxobacteraceae bacterium]